MPRKKSGITGPQYFSTFQVGRLLGVSPPTVVNWVNNDLLPAHRTPGGHRRITREDLVRFAREHDYPLPADFHEPVRDVLRVLVVDDEVDFCEMVREFLVVRGGFQVEIATSGFEAGLTVARFKPDFILMDIMMPDMDGFEVLRRLRGEPETAGIPVVACTAYRDPETEHRIAASSFDASVQKPLKLDQLLQVIRSHAAGVEVVER